jgi:hypothetical protein
MIKPEKAKTEERKKWETKKDRLAFFWWLPRQQPS